jgi:hypothetical protein
VREELEQHGMPVGRKHDLIAPPTVSFSERDFVRGLVDADGSLGHTSGGLPFVSLVVSSPVMADYWCDVIQRVTGATRTWRPNTRDGVANVMVTAEAAVRLAGWLYRPGDLALPRKAQRAVAVVAWERPATMPRRAPSRRWLPEEDEVLQGSSANDLDVGRLLGRTAKAVAVRRWRLSHGLVSPARVERAAPTVGGSCSVH